MSFEGTLDELLGFELLEADEEGARGRFAVSDAVRQPMGLVHGGAYAAFAESLASAATYSAVAAGGRIAMGQSNYTNFMRPVAEGTIQARATPVHRGRSTWLWDVEFTDDKGRLCATTRVTVAVRSAGRSSRRSGSRSRS